MHSCVGIRLLGAVVVDSSSSSSTGHAMELLFQKVVFLWKPIKKLKL